MYSQFDREEVIKKIVAHFSKFNEVQAVLLVGSNARGKADQYSDVDISMVVEEGKIEKLWRSSESFFTTKFEHFNHFMQYYNENSYLIGTCLKNGLEIDMGFCSLDEFNKTRSSRNDMPAKILYSREDFVLEEAKIPPKANLEELLSKRVSDMWYDYTNAIIAIKRQQLFRAASGIEEIRKQLIEIYAKANQLEYKHFRHVDKFDKQLKQTFIETYSIASLEAFKTVILKLLDIFIDLLNNFGHSDDAKSYREHFDRFIKEIEL